MSYQMHRISVLVVEDNLPMLEITKSLLLAFGVGQVVGAHDGEHGFDDEADGRHILHPENP
jgi:CheY-like chemotaxis protein